VTEGILVGMKRGLSKLEAAKEIVRQTVWPLLGATVIAIMAFAPIGLSDDATGEYTNTLFWVLLISLMLSWVTAITLVPFFANVFFSEKDVGGQDGEGEDPYAGRVFVLYRRLLDRAIHHRVIALSAMGALLVIAVVGFGFVKQAFFPPSNTPMFLVDYWLPQGSDIRATQDAAARLEQALLEMDGVEQVTTTVGQGAQRFMLPYAPEKSYPSYAQLIVQVADREQINPTLAATRELIRNEHLQAFAKVKRLMIGPSPAASIEARFSGPDPKELRALGLKAQAIMHDDGGLESIRHDWRQQEKVIRPQFQEAQARRAGITR
ncbi:efflux RND transporter permease subunit, partial [Alcanivorax sp. HI0044]